MNQKILLEIQTLFDVVKRRLDTEHPEGIDADLPLYSNELSEKELEQIRAGLQAKLATELNEFRPVVALGRSQDENEAGSLIVSFRKTFI